MNLLVRPFPAHVNPAHVTASMSPWLNETLFCNRMPRVHTGSVKFFDSGKGFGFIIPHRSIDGNAEVFVHHTVIHNKGGFKSLAEGEVVEFNVISGPKGLQATRVTGPNGSFVQGEQYPRFRPKESEGNADSARSVAVGPYFGYPHYPLPPMQANYPQVIAYSNQMPQSGFGAFAYPAVQSGNLGFMLPQPAPTNSSAEENSHAQASVTQQYYNAGLSAYYPQQQQQLVISAPFARQMPELYRMSAFTSQPATTATTMSYTAPTNYPASTMSHQSQEYAASFSRKSSGLPMTQPNSSAQL
ncbi:hypothetical protein LPJ66_006726 [Kickxella alabastrina]|uniref:Uncharacterized protein n=1 Tax=Kickxella alabastrina TaxID=61397 RepID=A0ACC1IEN8_9FUNG|nr:hypothetical protein LPJ66_006726 [Kickxella alabastrina]